MGVQAAANTYFGKDVDQLDLAECAMIAGISNSPLNYSPYLNFENAKRRQAIVLKHYGRHGLFNTRRG
jgi:membrane peptidoglycan carboxypeptidase